MALEPPFRSYAEQLNGLSPLRQREEAYRKNPNKRPCLWLCKPCYDGLRAEGVADRQAHALGNCERCSERVWLFQLWPFELRTKDEGREEIAVSTKVHENALRRIAKRRGFILMKTRTRDQLSPMYGRWLVSREEPAVHRYAKTLDEVEAILNS